jgi:hypothetical protein
MHSLGGAFSVNTIFSLSNLFVIPFWGLMILLPRWRWTQRIAQFPFFVAILALVYAILVIPHLPALLAVLSQPTVTSIAALLGTPAGATIGWVHFLAFDLFVGRWIYLDSHEQGISAWFVSPLLFLTFMFGPLGFLCYLCLRSGYALLRSQRQYKGFTH